eukprot:scaffold5615_cov103-Isochrysis_galbana.AAC.7
MFVRQRCARAAPACGAYAHVPQANDQGCARRPDGSAAAAARRQAARILRRGARCDAPRSPRSCLTREASHLGLQSRASQPTAPPWPRPGKATQEHKRTNRPPPARTAVVSALACCHEMRLAARRGWTRHRRHRLAQASVEGHRQAGARACGERSVSPGPPHEGSSARPRKMEAALPCAGAGGMEGRARAALPPAGQTAWLNAPTGTGALPILCAHPPERRLAGLFMRPAALPDGGALRRSPSKAYVAHAPAVGPARVSEPGVDPANAVVIDPGGSMGCVLGAETARTSTRTTDAAAATGAATLTSARPTAARLVEGREGEHAAARRDRAQLGRDRLGRAGHGVLAPLVWRRARRRDFGARSAARGRHGVFRGRRRLFHPLVWRGARGEMRTVRCAGESALCPSAPLSTHAYGGARAAPRAPSAAPVAGCAVGPKPYVSCGAKALGVARHPDSSRRQAARTGARSVHKVVHASRGGGGEHAAAPFGRGSVPPCWSWTELEHMWVVWEESKIGSCTEPASGAWVEPAAPAPRSDRTTARDADGSRSVSTQAALGVWRVAHTLSDGCSILPPSRAPPAADHATIDEERPAAGVAHVANASRAAAAESAGGQPCPVPSARRP